MRAQMQAEETTAKKNIPLYSRLGGLNKDKLRLINYSLSEKASRNLIEILSILGRTTIRHIHLEKCGINNPNIFNSLLESSSKKQHTFQSIIIRSEALGFKRELLIPLLLNHAPTNLAELKLEFCKLSKANIIDLTSCLKEISQMTCGGAALQTLSLIDANFSS